jgi:hypothetical protein
MLFFWNLGKELLESMKAFSEEELKKMNTASERNLDKDGDGINQSFISQMETSLELMQHKIGIASMSP